MSDENKYELMFRCHNCDNTWKEVLATETWVKSGIDGLHVAEQFASKYVRDIICTRCRTTRCVSRIIEGLVDMKVIGCNCHIKETKAKVSELKKRIWSEEFDFGTNDLRCRLVEAVEEVFGVEDG